MNVEKKKYSKSKKIVLVGKEIKALRVFNEKVYIVLKCIYGSKTPVFVEDIYELTKITKPTIYYCLRVLKDVNFLEYSTQSRFRTYRIADKKLELVKNLIALVNSI